jgi:hypothetical protein
VEGVEGGGGVWQRLLGLSAPLLTRLTDSGVAGAVSVAPAPAPAPEPAVEWKAAASRGVGGTSSGANDTCSGSKQDSDTVVAGGALSDADSAGAGEPGPAAAAAAAAEDGAEPDGPAAADV